MPFLSIRALLIQSICSAFGVYQDCFESFQDPQWRN
nr:MAG TPA_asm: hypothetical protein [Caudoviricetes sp.]